MIPIEDHMAMTAKEFLNDFTVDDYDADNLVVLGRIQAENCLYLAKVLGEYRSTTTELARRIDNLKDMNSPMNSHANGVLVGLIEAYELIMNGVESDE